MTLNGFPVVFTDKLTKLNGEPIVWISLEQRLRQLKMLEVIFSYGYKLERNRCEDPGSVDET